MFVNINIVYFNYSPIKPLLREKVTRDGTTRLSGPNGHTPSLSRAEACNPPSLSNIEMQLNYSELLN
jgi:hypothetical protein